MSCIVIHKIKIEKLNILGVRMSLEIESTVIRISLEFH